MFVQSAAITGALALSSGRIPAFGMEDAKVDTYRINIRPHEIAGPLPHFWEECAGSDRAIVGLRQQWLSDLERSKREIGIKSVRFHGLFNDEMGVWPGGTKQPNFLYVDMVFDAMMERGVRPFVELSFMPGGLASGRSTAFFYKGNTTPPTDMTTWAELIRSLGEHCVTRYGIKEVEAWAFEVWNEPNLKFFWAGTQADYFELYRHAATALKGVDNRLRVGGPSTAEAAWVGDLLDFCAKEKLPINFASTHIYPDDPQKIVFGTDTLYPIEEVIPRALGKVKEQIKSSQFPSLPLYITEWSSQNPAFIAHTVKGTIGLADILSYWTFDNVFEELGIPRQFLNNVFGLIGMRGIPRPSYHTFTLLHKLGESQLKTGEGPVLATKRTDGSMAVLLWNLIPQPPGQHSAQGDPALQTGAQYATEGATKEFVLVFEGEHKHLKGQITRVDENSGDLRRAYEQMGSPAYPTMQQIEELKKNSAVAKPENATLTARGELTVNIPPNGVALVELA
ncbi:MAG: GH39 family glycosyl hydrolase [Terracidiphilus sp.]